MPDGFLDHCEAIGHTPKAYDKLTVQVRRSIGTTTVLDAFSNLQNNDYALQKLQSDSVPRSDRDDSAGGCRRQRVDDRFSRGRRLGSDRA